MVDEAAVCASGVVAAPAGGKVVAAGEADASASENGELPAKLPVVEAGRGLAALAGADIVVSSARDPPEAGDEVGERAQGSERRLPAFYRSPKLVAKCGASFSASISGV